MIRRRPVCVQTGERQSHSRKEIMPSQQDETVQQMFIVGAVAFVVFLILHLCGIDIQTKPVQFGIPVRVVE